MITIIYFILCAANGIACGMVAKSMLQSVFFSLAGWALITCFFYPYL